MKQNWFYLFDKRRSLSLIGILLFAGAFALFLAVCAFLRRQFLAGVILCLVLMDVLAMLFLGFQTGCRLIRYTMRCCFTMEGITCRALFWGSYLIPWDDVRSYGCFYFTVGREKIAQIYCSANPDYFILPKSNMKLSKRSIAFMYRADLWEAMNRTMPRDMMLHIAASLRSGNDYHGKR